MKNKKIVMIIIILIITVLVVGTIIFKNASKEEQIKNKNLKIVTSFYPIYIMAENICQGAQNVELSNMAETTVGCIHDYTLTTTDLRKIENADVFIENGLGLESFIDKILTTYPDIKVIESSSELEKMLETEDTHEHHEEESHIEEEHSHKVNAHTWLSIDKYIIQIREIAYKLSEINPENKTIYMKNLEDYTVKLNELKQKYKELETSIKGKYLVSLNEAFEYINENIDINLITIETNHEKETFSAESLKRIIEDIKENDVKIIVVDKEDSLKNAHAIAEETGAKVCVLDSGLRGEKQLDSYIKTMESNLEVLKNLK